MPTERTSLLDTLKMRFRLIAVVTFPLSLVATIVVAAVMRNEMVLLPLGTLSVSVFVLATLINDYRKSGIKVEI